MKHKMIYFIVDGKILATGPHPMASKGPKVTRNDVRRAKKAQKHFKVIEIRCVHESGFCHDYFVVESKKGHKKIYSKTYWPL